MCVIHGFVSIPIPGIAFELPGVVSRELYLALLVPFSGGLQGEGDTDLMHWTRFLTTSNLNHFHFTSYVPVCWYEENSSKAQSFRHRGYQVKINYGYLTTEHFESPI
jgi:hypothetical protein